MPSTSLSSRRRCKEPNEQTVYREIIDDFTERYTLDAAFRNGFPDVVTRDTRVTAACLVLLAYRATHADDQADFALNEKALSNKPIVKPQSGLGKNNIRAAWALAQHLGYLRRWQPPDPNGRWKMAAEKLSLPPAGASGLEGQHLKRNWFDGSLPLKAMAAFLYIRAGTGLGPSIFVSEVAERFGWSRPTTAGALDELLQHRLIRRIRSRTRGRFSGVTYLALDASHWMLWSTVKKPGNGLPCHGKAGSLRTSPPHAPKGPPPRTLRDPYAAQGRAASPAPHLDIPFSPIEQRRPLTAEDKAWDSKCLLASIDNGLAIYVDPFDVDADTINSIAGVMPDRELRDRVKQATAGRVSAEILSIAGLFAVRWLAAFRATTFESNTGMTVAAAEALNFVLESMFDRIGSRPPERLNSLALISKRLIGDAYGYSANHLYGTSSRAK